MRTFNEVCNTQGDIYKHLPVLNKYAQDSKSILEIGLGQGNSAIAFLEAKPERMRTIEIDMNYAPGTVQEVRDIAAGKEIDFQIIEGDSRSLGTFNQVNQPVDFLFIDGDHSHLTVKTELEMYAPLVQKYIGFHDVVMFGYRDMHIVPENPHERGINWAIERFLQANPNWTIDYVSIFNNGLLILKKNG